MGKQYNAQEKLKRRKRYIKRKKAEKNKAAGKRGKS